jgi:hypothetical protein
MCNIVIMKYTPTALVALLITMFFIGGAPNYVFAQEEGEDALLVRIGEHATESFIGKSNDFSVGESRIPEGETLREIVWNFGDGTRMAGESVRHQYKKAGTYKVRVSLITEQGNVSEDSVDLRVFNHVALLITDSSVPGDQIELRRQRAAQEEMLLVVLRAEDGSTEVVTEQLLTNQMIEAREAIKESPVIILQTSGSVGLNVLSKFSQHVKQASDTSFEDLGMRAKGIILLSDTPFGVVAPAAQAVFTQMRPNYILLSRPSALDLLINPLSSEEARQTIVSSPIGHRLLGEFSARTIRDIGITNFMSFGINYLVNKGIPTNSITLILMLPVIATILSFSRQVIGIKAFGIVTPAMATLSFLVLGLPYGLLIFSAILASGTITRILLRRLHLLYLPRMALVLSSVSLAILLVFGLGAAADNTALASFSIFPILILTLLVEDFIALQFKAGARSALTVTAWTLALSIGCYFIVSWQLLRTLFVSYPELVLAAIPINILLGRWTGLRLTEYLRFRRLLRYMQ